MLFSDRGQRARELAELEDLRSVASEQRVALAEAHRRLAGPSDWFEGVRAQKVIVHQTSDQSIEGLLVGVWDDGISLRSATLLGQKPTPMAGEVFVPRSQVVMVQIDR